MLHTPVRYLIAGIAAFWAFGSVPAANAEEAGIVSPEEMLRQLALPAKTRPFTVIGDGDNAGRVQRKKIALPAIQFEFDSDRLTPVAAAQVEQVARTLQFPVLSTSLISVQGHTDSVGDAAYNRGLSLRRARAVKQFLVDSGSPAGKLVAVGLGEDFPIVGELGDDARNRRVELVNLGRVTELGQGVAETTPARAGGRRALLIGIGEYQHLSPLLGPVNDAKAMKSFLREDLGYGERDIRMLLNAEATREGILAAMEDWLVKGTGPGDEAFLYFSGHGFQEPDRNGDEPDRYDETLVAYDVALNDDNTIRGMISDDEMAKMLGRLSDRRVQVVIDSCHSGTSTKFTAVSDNWRYIKTPRRKDGGPIQVGIPIDGVVATASLSQEVFVTTKDLGLERSDITVWAAVKADQKALIDIESPADERVSVFTRRLLWGVRDRKADEDFDGIVTRRELQEYVVRESEAFCGRHPNICKTGLTPQVDASGNRLEVAAFGLSSGSDLLPVATTKDILVRQAEGLAGSFPSEVTLRIKDAADPPHAFEAQTSAVIGAEYEFVVASPRDGHLVLLDIAPDGKMVQLFPNDASLQAGVSSRISAGQEIILPGENVGFRFVVQPPAGQGKLVAMIVPEDSVQLQNLVSEHKDLSVVARPNAYLAELGEAVSLGSAPAAAILDYETVIASE